MMMTRTRPPEEIATVAIAGLQCGLFVIPPHPHIEEDVAERHDEIQRGLRALKEGRDPVFHKQETWLAPIEEPPFAALDCRLGKAPYMAFPLGGLWTRPTGEVLTAEGQPVAGLYAAGRTTCGISRSAEGYASGTCIADATYFGRLAGRRVASASPA